MQTPTHLDAAASSIFDVIEIRYNASFVNMKTSKNNMINCGGLERTAFGGVARGMSAIPPDAIASPCRKICAVDGMTNLCIGCGRTLQEIGGWTRLTDAQRAEIMAALPERLRRAHAASGFRA
jgi:uncharacterized protein